MDLLVDLFGFLSVILRGCALALAAIAIGGVIFRASVMSVANFDDINTVLLARMQRLQRASALGLLGVVAAGKGLDLSILTGTVGVPLWSAITAPFALAGITTCVGALALFASRSSDPQRVKWMEWLAAIAILAGLVATTHATGRVEARGWLVIISALHQGGGAAWIGGLPFFLLVLSAGLAEDVRARIAHRYSKLCVLAVLAIALSALAKYNAYLGAWDAIYGTAYGLMTSTKAVMFAALLAFGAGNFAAVRRLALADGGSARRRTQRFVEVEFVIGIGLFFVAGSLTSLPPAIDLPDDRVTWSTIVERVIVPRPPRLTSPTIRSSGTRPHRLSSTAQRHSPAKMPRAPSCLARAFCMSAAPPTWPGPNTTTTGRACSCLPSDCWPCWRVYPAVARHGTGRCFSWRSESSWPFAPIRNPGHWAMWDSSRPSANPA